MPNWTPADLADFERRRTKSWLEAASEFANETPQTPGHPASGPEPEPNPGDEYRGPIPGEESHPGRLLVVVVAYRRRLCDPDNLFAKYFIDCLRYAELIPNDRAEDIELTVRQKKVPKDEQRTEVFIYEP